MVSFVVIEVLDVEEPPEDDLITVTPDTGVTAAASSGDFTPTAKPKTKSGTKKTPTPSPDQDTPTPSSGADTPTPTQPADTPTPAADTTPPTIKNASVTPKDFVYNTNGSCSPTSFKFSVKVTDAGGVASVKLNWTGSGVRSGPVSMNKSGSKYVKTLGQFVNTGILKGFSISATDNSGNTSSISPNWNLDVEQCGGGS
jgi:hypothetical protein